MVQTDARSMLENNYFAICRLFLSLLGIIYLIAFASLAPQVLGLAGSDGIIPIADRMDALHLDHGKSVYWRLPSLFWINAHDHLLQWASYAGCIVSLLIIVGFWQRLALVCAFVLYLSLYHACHPFLNFQWDGLLLEAGFLAIFLHPGSKITIFLFRWLLFRLRFMSGLSKLTMGDPAWSGLTALNSYFEIQPLPTPFAWYAHQLPDWLLKFGTAGTLFVELLVPFMMFLPRRWRFAAAWLTIFWQLLIILTSNHNWINLLTIALCLFLFDDRALARVLPPSWFARLHGATATRSPPVPMMRLANLTLAGLILIASSAHLWELSLMRRTSGPIGEMLDRVEAFRVVSKYHVFPTMQTERYVLEIEGSADGLEWKPYVFRYAPGAVDERPGFVLPHQPRLDWQIWFVTLHPMHMPWFERFLYKLLDNSPSVTKLLAHNPFAEQPPEFLRANAWHYRFTTAQERRDTGHWWKRESLGPFYPLPGVSAKPVDYPLIPVPLVQ